MFPQTNPKQASKYNKKIGGINWLDIQVITHQSSHPNWNNADGTVIVENTFDMRPTVRTSYRRSPFGRDIGV
jgi:hypothetical protein